MLIALRFALTLTALTLGMSFAHSAPSQ